MADSNPLNPGGEMRDPDRDDLRESLEDATKRLAAAKATRKQDTRVHNESVKAIDDEISDIMDQLENLTIG